MANRAEEVLVGIPDVAGGVLVSATPLAVASYPADAAAAVPTGMVAVGFVSEDGVTESVSRNVEKVKAWGGHTVRTVQQDYETTYSFSFLQFKNGDVLKAVYGADNVTGTDGTFTVKKNAKVLERRSWLFEMEDGDTKIRLFVPNGQITEVGDVSYNHQNAIMLEVTIEAFPDENGDTAFLFTDTPAPAPVTP